MFEGGIAGVGVDLCSVERIARAMEREHFVARVFTQGERDYLQARGKGKAQSAAAMFAAKEAAAKALGTGFAAGVMPWLIEVTHEPGGAPGLRLHGAAQERFRAAGGTRMHVSLSHEGDMAIAFVVMQARADEAQKTERPQIEKPLIKPLI